MVHFRLLALAKRLSFSMLATLLLSASVQATTITVAQSVARVFGDIVGTGVDNIYSDIGTLSARGSKIYDAAPFGERRYYEGASVANISTGHLGGFASTNRPESVRVNAHFEVDIRTDGLLSPMFVVMTLSGSIHPFGSAIVYLEAGDQTGHIECTNLDPCFSVSSVGPVRIGESIVTVPFWGGLLKVDLAVEAVKAQPGTPGAFDTGTADFLNSADIAIFVPNGVQINGIGTGLFQVAQAVPEPSMILLFSAALTFLGFSRRKRAGLAR